MDAWSDFFVAETGASAALAGLLFVAISVNLARILDVPGLPERAGMVLVVLIQVLLISTCLLVPGQPVGLAGAEVLVIGALAWAAIVGIEMRVDRPLNPEYRQGAVFRHRVRAGSNAPLRGRRHRRAGLGSARSFLDRAGYPLRLRLCLHPGVGAARRDQPVSYAPRTASDHAGSVCPDRFTSGSTGVYRGVIQQQGGPHGSNPDRSHRTVMELTDTNQQLSQVIHRVAKGEPRVVVEKSGPPVAVIISTEEYRNFKDQEEARKARLEEIRETFAKFSDAFADVPPDELEREIAKARETARAELRAEREAAAKA